MDPKEIVQKEIDAFNNHDADAFAAVYTEDSSAYDPQYDKPLKGREAIRKDIADFFEAFPDVQVKVIGPIVVDENTAAFEIEVVSTHKGPLVSPNGPIPATNRRIVIRGGRFVHVTPEGHIKACNRYYDMMGIMAQLGLM